MRDNRSVRQNQELESARGGVGTIASTATDTGEQTGVPVVEQG
jgi:hypothetical protein